MPGYGGASSSGGARGEGGSGGAFTGGGLQTGKTWHGTKAHFSGGNLKGYSTNGGAFKSPMGQSVNSSFQSQGQGLKGLPAPGGYVPPVLRQPVPNIVPTAAPPPTNWYDALRASVPPGVSMGAFGTGFNPYNNLRSSLPPGNNFGGFGNQTGFGTTMNKNNMGAPRNNVQSHNTSRVGGAW